MKYSTHDYAKALDQALANPKGDKDAIAKNFLALVRRNGDEGNAKKILEQAARLARRNGGFRQVFVESARPLAKPQEKILENLLEKGDVVTYGVDPLLVAGIKITVNDEMQFDGTLKAKLDQLF